MEIGEFKRVFQIASSQIIDIAIKLGYINFERKEELTSKLKEYLQNEVAYEMKYKEETAEFNPNTHTMAFNVSKISSVQEALIIILHEEKHILDYYVDENKGFYDELDDHIGLQDKDEKGIGQNESCTERFATDVAEEILGKKIDKRNVKVIGLEIESNLPNYHIEDTLNMLFCEAMQISTGELLRIQNERSLEGIGELANKFNKTADYNKFRGAIDEIYRMIYVGDNSLFSVMYDENKGSGTLIQKNLSDYSKSELEKIGRVHKLIQMAQKEILKYVSKTNPSRIKDIKCKFIVTAPQFELTEQDEIEFDCQYPKIDTIYSRKEHVIDNSVSDFFAFLRGEVEPEETTTGRTEAKEKYKLTKRVKYVTGRKLGTQVVADMQDIETTDKDNEEMARQQRTISQTKENHDIVE